MQKTRALTIWFKCLMMILMITWGCLKMGYGMHWIDAIGAGAMLMLGIIWRSGISGENESTDKKDKTREILYRVFSVMLVGLGIMLISGYLFFGLYRIK